MLGMTSQIDLAAAAREHLPADVADTWLSLLRPGIRLITDDDGDGPPVGYLGGEPELPDDLAWPVWEGHGPFRAHRLRRLHRAATGGHARLGCRSTAGFCSSTSTASTTTVRRWSSPAIPSLRRARPRRIRACRPSQCGAGDSRGHRTLQAHSARLACGVDGTLVRPSRAARRVRGPVQPGGRTRTSASTQGVLFGDQLWRGRCTSSAVTPARCRATSSYEAAQAALGGRVGWRDPHSPRGQPMAAASPVRQRRQREHDVATSACSTGSSDPTTSPPGDSTEPCSPGSAADRGLRQMCAPDHAKATASPAGRERDEPYPRDRHDSVLCPTATPPVGTVVARRVDLSGHA